MKPKEVLRKNIEGEPVIHNSGVYGRTMIMEECALKAMDEYAKQKAWESWKYRAGLSEGTEMSSKFLEWWEENL